MTRYYPAFLQLAGKAVLLVGGGRVALQKAIPLGEAGARVTVVAPDVHSDMENVPGVAKILKRKFKAADLGKGAKAPWLVVAATNDEKVNAAIAKACDRARLWVNVVDRPAFCSFILPAIVRQGLVTFAVSTAGASPALAKYLAARVGQTFGPEIATLAETLGALRGRLKELPMAARAILVETALSRAGQKGFSPEALEAMRHEISSALERLE